MEVRINQPEMHEFQYGPTSPIVRKWKNDTRRTETAAKRRCPVDDGTLRASIQSSVQVIAGRIVGRVWSPLDYAFWQHEGTGPIEGNPYLAFRPKKGGPHRKGQRGGKHKNIVIVTRTKGVPANPFLEDALRDTVPWPVRRTLS